MSRFRFSNLDMSRCHFPKKRFVKNPFCDLINISQETCVSFRCMSLIAWAFATTKDHKVPGLAQLAECMTMKVHEAECQDMAALIIIEAFL